jgi:hypothetical protein
MKAIIKNKLTEIETKMQMLESMHLYYLNKQWQTLNTQRLLLEDLINHK